MGFKFTLLSPEQGFQYYSNDERWNKVKILMNSIHPDSGWGRDYDYVVFLDADLVVLDLKYDLRELVKAHDWAHMLASRDTETQNGVVNSGLYRLYCNLPAFVRIIVSNTCSAGFIIMKNSPWSYQFLENWWGTPETREMATDQHAFSTLWMENKQQLESKVALLAPDVLNSDFPAWRNQKYHDQVLHLAGALRRLFLILYISFNF